MAIVRYEPWNLVSQLHDEVNRLFDHRLGKLDREAAPVSDWLPAVDVKEEAERYVILADLPGVDAKDIEVSMENGQLTLRGQRETDATLEKDNFKRVERARGTFFRRFTLPDTADAERVTARSRNGVLEVVIPKSTRPQPRKIQVET